VLSGFGDQWSGQVDCLTLLGLGAGVGGGIGGGSSDPEPLGWPGWPLEGVRFLLVQLDVCRGLSHFHQSGRVVSHVVVIVCSYDMRPLLYILSHNYWFWIVLGAVSGQVSHIVFNLILPPVMDYKTAKR